MCDETIGDDFHDAFNGENNQEDIFHFFLSSKMLRMIEAKKKGVRERHPLERDRLFILRMNDDYRRERERERTSDRGGSRR